jgi:hypothetical protein
MKTIKFMNYFNLVAGIILLWIYIRSSLLYYDHVFIVGIALTIWYNWETLKQLKGQRNRLNRLNYIIGTLTVVFGVFLILVSVAMINEGLKDRNTHITMGIFYIPLGVTTVLLSLRTLKLYRGA